jgi:hypothetical protein
MVDWNCWFETRNWSRQLTETCLIRLYDILRSWRWRRHAPWKLRFTFNVLHGILYQTAIKICAVAHFNLFVVIYDSRGKKFGTWRYEHVWINLLLVYDMRFSLQRQYCGILGRDSLWFLTWAPTFRSNLLFPCSDGATWWSCSLRLGAAYTIPDFLRIYEYLLSLCTDCVVCCHVSVYLRIQKSCTAWRWLLCFKISTLFSSSLYNAVLKI